MYRRILIPVDGSPCSDDALTHGRKLAVVAEGLVRTTSIPVLLIRKR